MIREFPTKKQREASRESLELSWSCWRDNQESIEFLVPYFSLAKRSVYPPQHLKHLRKVGSVAINSRGEFMLRFTFFELSSLKMVQGLRSSGNCRISSWWRSLASRNEIFKEALGLFTNDISTSPPPTLPIHPPSSFPATHPPSLNRVFFVSTAFLPFICWRHLWMSPLMITINLSQTLKTQNTKYPQQTKNNSPDLS